MRKLLILLAFLLIGALAGWACGPALSRMNYIVQVAERIWLEESQGLKERTLQSTAYRATGMPAAQLYDEARSIRAKFRIGGLFFGLWCGAAAGLTTLAAAGERARKQYEADPADCFACGRCYLSCPLERERLGKESGLS